ncbi:ribosome small subunit-dependent GTPase A [Nonomuraea sp. JJY05]|jgi:ribosome biogenesis GTPase|uniref:ribosome small subunit-dependent GTPase A n=1 Tax=Nonomuraea sp. JJY05 TaxID=3350255 RepID=UPI00373EE9AE
MSDWTYGLAALGWPAGVAWPRRDTMPARIAAVHGSIAEACVVDLDSEVGWVRHGGVRLGGSLAVTPVAGDWTAMSGDEVVEVLPRRTSLTRPSPSGRGIQTLAANVDTVVVTVPVDRGLNQRMVERLTVMAWDSGGRPVLALTKCDACIDVPEAISEARSLVPGVEVVATSSVTGDGVERLRELVAPGATATLLGASGVGKTSLLNVLGDRDERVAAVARDGEGRHTTTTRRLHPLAGRGVLIDLPGIRALDLSAGREAITDVFTEITELARRCRFSDCSHEHEPGCAVRQAVASGRIPKRRLDAWDAIHRQLAHEARKHDPLARAAEKAKWKAVSKEIRRRERG